MKGIKVSKLIAIVLATVAALLLSAFAVACSDATPPPATPTKLVLDYSDVKVDYVYDEPFTYAGLKVSVEMSDGTKQDVTTGYKVTPPEMTPGQHMVTVTYGSLSAKYAVYVEDIIKTFDDAEMFTVNGDGVYVIEAENINLDKCIAEPCDSNVGFIGKTRSQFVSGKAYLQNIGANGNCVGASFYSHGEHNGVILAVNMGNMTAEDIVLSDAVAMYFGFKGGDDMGELDLTDMTLKANSWQTLVFDNLSLETYGNIIVEFIDDADIVWDSARIIVGSNGINVNSAVNLSAASEEPVTLEVENMNTEKLITTESVAAENGLKFGQPNLKDGVVGTSGKYVSDLKAGAAVSSYIYADKNMKVNFKFNANIPDDYDVASSWKFTVDGYVFDGAKATSAGWTEVDLGTVGLKEGKHLFIAELKGRACEVDNFVFDTSELAGDDDVIFVEEILDKDAVIYNCGSSYRVEAEDLLDRSGWKNRLNTADETYPIEYTPGGKSMIERWWWNKDGSKGYGITHISDDTVIKIHTVFKVRTKIMFDIRTRKWKGGANIPFTDVLVKIGDNQLSWYSNDDFTHTDDDLGNMPWGILHCFPITLDAGEYDIELRSGNVCYDWFEINTYDPSAVLRDVEIDSYGTYRVEAENLLDKSGWEHAWNTDDKTYPIDYTPGKDSMVDQWWWSKDKSNGMGVTRIKSGSIFKINFTLETRSQIVFKIRIRKYQCVFNIPDYDVRVKIGETALPWWSGDDFTHPHDGTVYKLEDMPWGILRCDPITLDAGSHTIELTSGDVCYDWFEIETYDPSETISDVYINACGSYKVEAENLIDRTGWEPVSNYTVKEMRDIWSRDDISGVCIARMKDGSKFALSFTLGEKSVVKISVAVSKWGNGSTEFGPSWMRDTKIGESALNFTSKEGTSFKDESNGSRAYFGIRESESVTLEAGRYEFTWISDAVNYDYLILDVTAPEA